MSSERVITNSDQEIELNMCLVFDDKAKVQECENDYSQLGGKLGKIFLKAEKIKVESGK
jgi:hypothetical protein